MVDYCRALDIKFHSQVRYTQLGMMNDNDFEEMISQLIIPAAMKVIDNYCQHNFQNNQGGTILLDGSGDRVLMIPPPYLPVISTSSVLLGGVDISSNIKAYESFLHYEGGVFTKTENSKKNVTVVLNYGYTSIPDDIVYAASQVGANILNSMVRRKLVPNIMTEAFSTETHGFAALLNVPVALTADIKDILDKYRFSYMEVG